MSGLPYGSPPRAWGRQSLIRTATGGNRFTPTCVGTAAIRPMRSSMFSRFTPTCVGTAPRCCPGCRGCAVHPHVRGDGANLPHIAGSTARFTPTCVGTAGWLTAGHFTRSVHPHVRGDGTVYWPGLRPAFGSPPRAWGRPSRRGRTSGLDRFTPTCVGTATTNGRNGWLCAGSPPRAWGRPTLGNLAGGLGRFTPTCVGTAIPRPQS